MKDDTPIVFVHKGRSWYLPYVVQQAAAVNPASGVILIGNDLKIQNANMADTNDLESDELVEFKRHYSHMSSNSEEYEIFCWQRWFYLLEYMRRQKIRSVLHLDSDVLLYSSIETIQHAYSSTPWDMALMIPRQQHNSFRWVASGHISYWTIDCLEEFCHFSTKSFTDNHYLSAYRDKLNWHITNRIAGGICDMTTLYLYWNERKTRIFNLAADSNGNVFDDGIGHRSNYEDDEYAMDGDIKRVKFRSGMPYLLKNNMNNQWVKAHALHFQGEAKKHIPNFYSGPDAFKLFLERSKDDIWRKVRKISNRIRKS